MKSLSLTMDLFENVYENGIRIGDKYPIEHTNRKRVGVAEVLRIRRVEYYLTISLKIWKRSSFQPSLLERLIEQKMQSFVAE